MDLFTFSPLVSAELISPAQAGSPTQSQACTVLESGRETQGPRAPHSHSARLRPWAASTPTTSELTAGKVQ